MNKDKGNLLKRARHKYLSYGLSSRLHFGNPESPLSDSYFGSLLCCDVVRQRYKLIESSYCNQRWCLVCNRIRTARLISGYLGEMQRFRNPYFVTLTKKTVTAEDLPASMAYMAETWRKIADTARKSRKKFRGVRKAECTIRPGGLYHYHFHLVIEGKGNAQWLINTWLDRMGDQADARAQDMRPANDNSLKELFKYFTKLTAKDKAGKVELIDPKRMDVIFQAMRGKRVFQPFGGIRILSEEIEARIGECYDHLENEVQLWKWYKEDWINELGECLTGYRPNDKFAELVNADSLVDQI